ncbi:MAG: enoyl-CoA hydratase/isomerase family protein [Syntrophales bacterium]|nr:enoyl-CoA hydratase/isomerase family protein [Syntrophales bacterium]
MGSNVLTEKREKATIIKLNMPNKANALEKGLRDDLKTALRQFQHDDKSHVAVITGEGKAFCAGGSLEEIKDGMDVVGGMSHMTDHNEVILMIANIEKPIIAAVNGAAVGAGFSLALACDMIIASTKAIFAQAFTKVGLVPDMGSSYFLPRAVGMHRAKELILTAKTITAEEAYQMGIANHVVIPGELEARVFDMAKKIADGPGFAFGLGKAILAKSLESSLQEILQCEASAQCMCFQSEDHKEGIQAFFAKRSPVFTGK